VVGQRPVAPDQRNLAARTAPQVKKNAAPSAGIIDSQSVKCADTVGAGSSGYDAGKKIKGRKRHLLTDTQGLLLGVHVGPASVQDRDGAKVLCCLFCHLFLSVTLIFADGGYQGKLEDWVRQMGTLFGNSSLALEIIKRCDKAKGFKLLPRRWVVERTFGWLMKSRRLVRDYERKPSHHEAFVYLAMIGFAAKRLTK
jgi:transposase